MRSLLSPIDLLPCILLSVLCFKSYVTLLCPILCSWMYSCLLPAPAQSICPVKQRVNVFMLCIMYCCRHCLWIYAISQSSSWMVGLDPACICSPTVPVLVIIREDLMKDQWCTVELILITAISTVSRNRRISWVLCPLIKANFNWTCTRKDLIIQLWSTELLMTRNPEPED